MDNVGDTRNSILSDVSAPPASEYIEKKQTPINRHPYSPIFKCTDPMRHLYYAPFEVHLPRNALKEQEEPRPIHNTRLIPTPRAPDTSHTVILQSIPPSNTKHCNLYPRQTPRIPRITQFIPRKQTPQHQRQYSVPTTQSSSTATPPTAPPTAPASPSSAPSYRPSSPSSPSIPAPSVPPTA